MRDKFTRLKMKTIHSFTEKDVLMRGRRPMMDVPSEYAQMYMVERSYTIHLRSTFSREFVDYLLPVLGRYNAVDVSSRAIKEFQSWLGQQGARIPSVRTMREVIEELTECRILLRLSRGVYSMNPIVYWRGTAKDREDCIRSLIEGGHEMDPIKGNGELQEHSETTDSGAPEEGSDGEVAD